MCNVCIYMSIFEFVYSYRVFICEKCDVCTHKDEKVLQ